MKRTFTTAALLIALAISITSASALTSNQVQEIKKQVLSVPVPEMPAKAAEVVSSAKAKDRQAVAVTAVRAVVMKHRAAAPLVISAISKAAPELAPVVAGVAAELVVDQSTAIVAAAAAAAPAQATEIRQAVPAATPIAVAPVRTNPTRGNADNGGPSQGTIDIVTTPVGGGEFPDSAPTTPDEDPVVIYNQPPN